MKNYKVNVNGTEYVIGIELMSEEEAKIFFEESKKEAMERRKRLAEGPGVYVESSKKAQDFKYSNSPWCRKLR